MSNVVSPQTLEDGNRNTVIKVDIKLDSSDLTPQTLVDPSTLSFKPKRVRVDRIDWDVQDGLAVYLDWDGNPSSSLWRMVGRSQLKHLPSGSIQNNATNPTGKINVSTKGWQTGQVLGATFLIHCVKQ